MEYKYRRRRRILFWTTFLGAAFVALHFSAWLNDAMAGPLSPEWKLNQIDVQITIYWLLVAPRLLLVIAAAVAIEFAVFHINDFREARRARMSAGVAAAS